MATFIAKVIGANARKLRLDAGVTLDQFALAARFCGLPWSTGRCGDFEAGRVLPNLETIYAAALALSQAIGRDVSLAELLASDQPVQINDKLSVDPSALADAMSGQPVTGETENHRRLGGVVGKFTRKMAVPVMLDAFREADVRMCRTIGVTRERGAAAMYELWGRPFSDERDHRGQPGANAQHRGQISRQLKAQLVEELKRAVTNGND